MEFDNLFYRFPSILFKKPSFMTDEQWKEYNDKWKMYDESDKSDESFDHNEISGYLALIDSDGSLEKIEKIKIILEENNIRGK